MLSNRYKRLRWGLDPEDFFSLKLWVSWVTVSRICCALWQASQSVCVAHTACLTSGMKVACSCHIENRSKRPQVTVRPADTSTRWCFLHVILTVSVLAYLCCTHCLFDIRPRGGELWMQKLKSHLVRTWSLNVLPLKPGVSRYIPIRAMLTARDFFLAYFYPSSPFTCIFSKPLLSFSCVGCG